MRGTNSDHVMVLIDEDPTGFLRPDIGIFMGVKFRA
jgi:hypothetical protein